MMKPRVVGLMVAALALTGVMAAPAEAHHTPSTRFAETDLVSNVAGRAQLQDTKLQNAWGLALGPTTPLWVVDNGTDSATLYAGGAAGGTQRGLEGGGHTRAPARGVVNDTTGFMVNGAPALFIFDTENGDIAAWNQAGGTTAVRVAGTDGAIYKGLALLHTDQGPFLLAADFHNARIDVFDSTFTQVALPKW